MNVISLDDDAFQQLYTRLFSTLQQQLAGRKRDKWISGAEAMSMLRIKSKSTLQQLRDEGHIRFSQPKPKIILYDSDSIDAYLERHVRASVVLPQSGETDMGPSKAMAPVSAAA